MQVEEKEIKTNEEIISLIREGKNPLDYIKTDFDIDMICNAIAYIETSEDSYWDDMSETLLKAIIFYVLFKGGENKTLARCKEIVEIGINDDNSREIIGKMVECDERSKVLFKAIDIASDKTYKSIFKTLNTKLLKLS